MCVTRERKARPVACVTLSNAPASATVAVEAVKWFCLDNDNDNQKPPSTSKKDIQSNIVCNRKEAQEELCR